MTPLVRFHDHTGQYCPIGFESLPDHGQAKAIKSSESSQIRTVETGWHGSVKHVEVFQMTGVGTFIIGRPRPPTRQRRAGRPTTRLHTLNWEEPRNLIQQDAYASRSIEPAKVNSWAKDASKAVRPLSACLASHIQAVAQNVEETWGDSDAAAVVAAAIRKLITDAPQGIDVRLTRNGLGPFRFGAPEKEVLPYLKAILGNPKTSGGVGGCEAAGFGYQSYSTFGPLRVRFAAKDNSSRSARTLGSWDVWLKSARQGKLTLDQSIPFGLTLKQLKAKYPDGGYFEYMGAWSAKGVLIVPDEPKKGTHMIHSGDLDWCI